MPGLFGILRAEPGAVPQDAPGIFENMGQVLRHYPEERLEAWADPEQGIFLGRIGLPHVHPVPWPSPNEHPFFLIGGSLTRPRPRLEQKPTTSEWIQGVRDMRGFFAAAIYQEGRCLLTVDRHASLPLYYYQGQGWLAFAPETKALLTLPPLPRKENRQALANFVVSGFMPADQTLFQDIRRLRGGNALVMEEGTVRLERYWNYRPAAQAGTRTWNELELHLGDLVEQAVQRNLGDPEKTVLFLSGGFDSRAILGGARKAMGGAVSRLQTVSWGEEEGPPDSDVATAKHLAASLGLRHQFIQRRTDEYRSRFLEVNRLVDAQSEIAAFHPHEYAIMKELHARGFERVLRGDECFGYSYHVRDFTGALAVVWLHRLRDATNGRDFLRADLYDDLCAASDASIDSLLAEVEGMGPDEAKDYFYFSHRLQGYLNTASYYKRCLLDQRNVLLDESFLDLMEQVPGTWRIDKKLFASAVQRRFPDLYRFPMAKRHNLEDWAKLLGTPSPVRSFALEELADEASGIWEWFDRAACQRYLEDLTRAPEGPRRKGLKGLAVNLFLKMPKWVQAPVQAWKASRPAYRLAPEYVLMRILTLKEWHDRLITGRVK